ncbi:hypothetical protein LTR60_002488 [Cryomyces antarcticus]|nr:hypothetical protein LTR60_002488 [Cryomyces antarcticus]
MDMDVDGNSNSSSNARDDKDTFESSLDTAFQRFADRIADNPTQVLRYEFRGRPLLYSTTDPVGSLLSRPSHTPANALPVPPCANCAAPRVFELQLTPHAISELEVHETGLEGMEWGTVLLGVCGRDCAPRGQEAGEVGSTDMPSAGAVGLDAATNYQAFRKHSSKPRSTNPMVRTPRAPHTGRH